MKHIILILSILFLASYRVLCDTYISQDGFVVLELDNNYNYTLYAHKNQYTLHQQSYSDYDTISYGLYTIDNEKNIILNDIFCYDKKINNLHDRIITQSRKIETIPNDSIAIEFHFGLISNKEACLLIYDIINDKEYAWTYQNNRIYMAKSELLPSFCFEMRKIFKVYDIESSNFCDNRLFGFTKFNFNIPIVLKTEDNYITVSMPFINDAFFRQMPLTNEFLIKLNSDTILWHGAKLVRNVSNEADFSR